MKLHIYMGKMLKLLYYTMIMINLYPVRALFIEDKTTLRAIPGQDSRVPCGLGKVFLDGPEAFVQWTKNDREFLYRYPPETPEKNSKYYDRIGSMPCTPGTTCDDETALLIKSTSAEDVAMYRCRVFYQFSPTEDYQIDLRLAAPPSKPRLYDSRRMDLTDSFVGPVELGSDFTLLCEVKAEDPETLVYWRRNGLVMERGSIVRPGMLQAVVHVHNVTRGDFEATYECLANNADVAEPLTSTVFVKINLPPISIEIRLDNKPYFEVGIPRVVDCVVIGSVPPPTITWYLGQKMLRSNVHKELHDGNFTVSTVSLTLSLRDDKQSLACKAHNSQLPNIVLQDNVTLNVGYTPICVKNVKIGTKEADNIKTIECTVDGWPTPVEFKWIIPDKPTTSSSTQMGRPENDNRLFYKILWIDPKGDVSLLCCRFFNAFGKQIIPCSFNASGEQLPAPECVIRRTYPDIISVDCEEGWDREEPKSLVLEVYYQNKIYQNTTENSGHFQMNHVDPVKNLTVSIYSTNVRARSSLHTSEISYNIQSPDTIELDESPNATRNWPFWVEASIIFGAVVVITLCSFYMCIKIIIERNTSRSESDIGLPRVRSLNGSFHREPDVFREGPQHNQTSPGNHEEIPMRADGLVAQYKFRFPVLPCDDSAYYV